MKAQFYLTDYFVAILIFVLLTFIYHSYTSNYTGFEVTFEDLIVDAKIVSNALLSTGIPSNWTLYSSPNVLKYGLLNNEGEIDENKVINFFNTSYNDTFSKFNVMNDFLIFFNDKEGKRIAFENLSEAGEFNNASSKVAKISRIVTFNKTLIELNIWSWYE